MLHIVKPDIITEVFDLNHVLAKSKGDIVIWKDRYEKLKEQTKDFMKVLK